MLDVSLKGMDELRATLKALAFDNRTAEVADAVTDEFLTEFNASQELVPVLTGRLRRSGRLIPAVVTGEGSALEFTAAIVYGGPDVPYAMRQHGRYHYLASPMQASARFMGQRLTRRMKGLLIP